ncbi:MAG: alpha/beta hydrolase [Myxococcales bacterium]|nr:alpha/beta hydrolase [Myxococcales bacterium]
MLALVLTGILVTTQNGTEIAREKWRDDGVAVTSDIDAAGQKLRATIDRKKHTLHLQKESDQIDVPIPDGAAALMNMHWAAYGVLAEQFKSAGKPTAFKAVIGPERTIDATVTVKAGAAGGREILLTVGPLEVHATVDKRGAVTRASVPSQGIDVKTVDADAPVVRRVAPPGVVEDPFDVTNGSAKLSGVTWRPQGDKPVPVVIMIAGSGPVDRDGNAGGLMRTDAYRQLAEALAKRGVASIRYDKRGIGLSSFSGAPDSVTFDDFVGDAAALVAMARTNAKFSSVFVFGHSEGSLIALKLAARTKLDGIISAAGAGRPLLELVREQYARQLPPDEMKEFDTLAAALKAGKPVVAPKSMGLAGLFRPEMSKFLPGLLLTDPRTLAGAFKGPLTVLQGDNDVQVTVDRDAKPLAAAHAGAKLVVLKDVAHTLKTDTVKGLSQPSYRDPALPLAAGVVDAVVGTIR